MTDILDLQDWRVTATRQEDGELVIEAEYSVQPAACLKCGVIGRLYKHGPKPITIRDSPVRGRPVRSRSHRQAHSAGLRRDRCRAGGVVAKSGYACNALIAR